MNRNTKHGIRFCHSKRPFRHSERKQRIWPTKGKFFTSLFLLFVLVFTAAAGREEPTKSLSRAVREGDIEQVGLHISIGFDINAQDWLGRPPLHLAAEHGRMNVAKVLIANGAYVNTKDEEDYTPLHYAAFEGDKDIAELLATQDADINAKNNRRQSLLCWAKEKGHKEIVEFLCKHGAKE